MLCGEEGQGFWQQKVGDQKSRWKSCIIPRSKYHRNPPNSCKDIAAWGGSPRIVIHRAVPIVVKLKGEICSAKKCMNIYWQRLAAFAIRLYFFILFFSLQRLVKLGAEQPTTSLITWYYSPRGKNNPLRSPACEDAFISFYRNLLVFCSLPPPSNRGTHQGNALSVSSTWSSYLRFPSLSWIKICSAMNGKFAARLIPVHFLFLIDCCREAQSPCSGLFDPCWMFFCYFGGGGGLFLRIEIFGKKAMRRCCPNTGSQFTDEKREAYLTAERNRRTKQESGGGEGEGRSK